MISATITVSEEEIRKRLGNLAKKSGSVISRAANRSINTGKKAIKQETTKVYNVKVRDVENILKVKRATVANPVVRMTFSDYHRNLYGFGNADNVKPRFPVRSSSPYNPEPGYVKAKVKRANSSTPLDGRPKPFVQIAKNGYVLLFQRTSDDSRAPIRGVAAPAMPQILKNDEVIARFNRDTYSMFNKRLNHEIEQVLKGANS